MNEDIIMKDLLEKFMTGYSEAKKQTFAENSFGSFVRNPPTLDFSSRAEYIIFIPLQEKFP